MNADAEAEIERLRGMIYLEGADDNPWITGRSEALRAAMEWAYKDAAFICRKGPFIGDRQDCAMAIEARAGLDANR